MKGVDIQQEMTSEMQAIMGIKISTENNLVFFTCYSSVQCVVNTGIQIPGLISSRR